jgi:hypothetical protein
MLIRSMKARPDFLNGRGKGCAIPLSSIVRQRRT